MLSRSVKQFVADIIEAMEKIERYCTGMDEVSFRGNDLVRDAVIRNLEVIGEAAGHIPQDIRDRYQKIPWRRMIGLRNLVIHDYSGIDTAIIWEIVTRNIPETKPAFNQMSADLLHDE